MKVRRAPAPERQVVGQAWHGLLVTPKMGGKKWVESLGGNSFLFLLDRNLTRNLMETFFDMSIKIVSSSK